MCPIHKLESRDPNKVLEKLRFTTFRMKSFLWVDRRESEPLHGFGFISEFTTSGVGLYLTESVPATSSVRLAFETVEGISYRGMVMWSNRFAFRQQYLGHEALKFRIGVRYVFGSEAERQRYLKYLEEIRNNALNVKGKMIY
jgi:hypothetical protein